MILQSDTSTIVRLPCHELVLSSVAYWNIKKLMS